MNKKILIIGSRGMLGQDMAKFLADFNLILWDQPEIDITDQNQINSKIKNLKPDIVINCAAYTDVDGCETNQDLAMQVNGSAVGYLAEITKKLDAILIHISTDYIFNGQNKDGYEEDSQEIGPLNIYGQSKLKGELLLQEKIDKYYLIRTSWLYGKNGKNFVETMLKLAQENDSLKVVNDQFGKPTLTIDLARQIRYILDNNLDFGSYHIINETQTGGISWYDFTRKIFELAEIKINLQPCTTAEFSRPAQRPAYSALINTKLPQLRNWQEALSEYLEKVK
ncbi:MAG: dTDP-4-dehydrorhamnose reductase [Candidatus Buchananbacteria bacterium]|nr:dTDP-4-dehydrorhamnose reductase [Candidatus Buchananbacteria bacterium]